MTQKMALGKGLSSLLGESVSLQDPDAKHFLVDINALHKSSYQPRKIFNEDELVSLASSIKTHGILQPILVRGLENEQYEIVAGERRWRAARIAGLDTVPVIIMALSELQAIEISLLENIQRQDLSPIEEAEGYKQLFDHFNHTQESLSKVLGKSRSHIANMMRLLSLPEDIKVAIESGDLTVGHAKLLIGSEDPSFLAKHIIANRLNVNEADSFIKQTSPIKRKQSRHGTLDPEISNLAKQLQELTGMKSEIRPYGSNKGKIILDYTTLEQLDLFLHRLSAHVETVPYGTAKKG